MRPVRRGAGRRGLPGVRRAGGGRGPAGGRGRAGRGVGGRQRRQHLRRLRGRRRPGGARHGVDGRRARPGRPGRPGLPRGEGAGPHPGRGRTGRCLVLLLPDGERAFLIWQGERRRLRMLPEALEACLADAGSCQGMLVEGYLLASEDGCAAARDALRRAVALGARRVLALSDPALVRTRRRRFAELLATGVDVVLGNEAEATALTGAGDAEAAAAMLAGHGMLAVVTLGARGALAHGPGGRHRVAAPGSPVTSAVGAGDAFAGGFLGGLLSDLSPPECLALGAARARAVLTVRQARAPVPPELPKTLNHPHEIFGHGFPGGKSGRTARRFSLPRFGVSRFDLPNSTGNRRGWQSAAVVILLQSGGIWFRKRGRFS
ncbi:carbohydrate kinase family protein [Streptomyces nogalater]